MTEEKSADDTGLMLPLVEEFFSIQGEGYHTGKAAYFVRIGGCDVGCSWCDSRFSWNPALHPMARTSDIVRNAVSAGADSVVVTGGEPLMWNLDMLTEGFSKNGIKTFLETSGAYPLSGKWDWICLSPKQNMPPLAGIFPGANELKVIIETTEDFEWAETNRKSVGKDCLLYLQPEWSRFDEMIPLIVGYVQKHSEWRISLQVHKYMHIP